MLFWKEGAYKNGDAHRSEGAKSRGCLLEGGCLS